MYRDPSTKELWEGSPIRIMRAVERGRQKSKRQYPLDVKYIFIDNQSNHLKCLENFSIPQSGFDDEFIRRTANLKKGIWRCCQLNYHQTSVEKGHSLFFRSVWLVRCIDGGYTKNQCSTKIRSYIHIHD